MKDNAMISKIVNIVVFLALIVAIAITSVVFFMNYCIFTNSNSLSYKVDKYWIYESESEKITIELPTIFEYKEGNKKSVFYTYLPKRSNDYTHIYLNSEYSDVSVYIDDKCIFTEKYDENIFSKTNGKRNLFIELPKEWHGKKITIEFTPQIKIEGYKFTPPSLCYKDLMIQSIYQNNQPIIVINILLFAFGIACIVFGIIGMKLMKNNMLFFAVGLATISMAFYIVAENDWFKIISGNPVSSYTLECASIMMTIIPLTVLFKNETKNKVKSYLNVFLAVAFINMIVQGIIMFTTEIALRQMMIFSQAINTWGFFSFIIIIIMSKRWNISNRIYLIVSFLPISILNIINAVAGWVSGYTLGFILIFLGILSFTIAENIYILKQFHKLLHVRTMGRIYKNMAFVDALTKLKNRNAFEEDVKQLTASIEMGLSKNLSIIAIDVDNLKYVNDHFGHIAGDNMIVAMAEHLKEGFPNAFGIYRLGGDEFLVVSPETDIPAINEKMANLRDYASKNSYYKEFKIDFSFGAVLYVPDEYKSIIKSVREADVLMYKMKEEHHKNE